MILATIGDNEKPVTVNMPSGPAYHAPLTAQLEFIFSEKGGGVAYVIEKAGTSRVVHNGVAGKPYKTVGTVVLSPDGKRIAYGALVDGKWRMVVDGKEGAPFNTVKSPLFSPDGSHLAYQAMAGERWHIVVDAAPNAGTPKRYLSHEFSGDSSRIAYIDDVDDKATGRLVVSDLAFSRQTVVATGVLSMQLNADKTRIAALSTSNGTQSVMDFTFDKPESVRKGQPYENVQGYAFGPDGAALAYIAIRAGKPLMVMNSKEMPLPDGVMANRPVIHPDMKVAGSLMFLNGTTYLQELPQGTRESGYETAESLVYSSDGRYHAYAAKKGENWFVVVNGKEGPAFDRVVTPKFSPDGKYLVYRARKSGRRFVVVADATGKTVKAHPEYEQVFEVQFTADGKSIAYGVKDGQKLIWMVEAL
ncbi:TolB family protein [Geobacter pickeringii]|nr:PD40 domain-containing protein [Geobacter pickeringii]